MSYINFESSRVKEQAREEKRKARELLLEKVEADYHRRKYQEEQRKERGEDKWILPSVDARIQAEANEMKKKKKKKIHKKEKKKKKKRERVSSSSSSSSSEEDEWVEKKEEVESNTNKERDEWMTAPGLFPCVTRDELRQKTKTLSEAEKKKERDKYMLDSLGQSERELNPYWKDGGCGLPQTSLESGSPTLAAGNVGDGGANWLRRALSRAKQQAAEEGRSLEDVAAERWGSLEKLESLIEEAENRRRPGRRDERRHKSSNEFRRPASDENPRTNKSSDEFRKPGMDDSYSSRDNMASSRSGSKNWRKKTDTDSRPSRKEEITRTKSPSASSSSSSCDEEEDLSSSSVLTEKEMNELAAKLVKAELLGNEKLATELKKKLDAARAAKKDGKSTSSAPSSSKQAEEETVILTRTDKRGFVRPCATSAEPSGGRRKKQKVETHADGKRMRYFADDDRYSLQDLFEREKLSTIEDQNEAFARLAAKGVGRSGSDFDMDDVFEERARMKESDGKAQARERDRAVREHKRADRALDGCNRCFGSKETQKHLIVAIGNKAYLCLPKQESLTPGHCLIVPMFHTTCATQLDEDVWAEIQTFRKTLTAMFSKMDQDPVFFETAMHLGRFPHMVLECVPLPKETGSLAPMYFKKAILECEMEWSNNKKLVDLRQKDVRRSVPKGLPYFFVDFGLDGGFAHVIEDEKLFPKNFAYEIIGGMLDIDHRQWRKGVNENFNAQCKKVVEFAKWWKPFDFTHKD